MCELLAVSADYVHDQTRRKRIPITEGVSNTILEDMVEDVVSADANLTQLSGIEKSLYACPSAWPKACLDDKVEVDALLDDGSELNIMANGTFEKVQHPIDTDINWRINGYNAKVEEKIMELGKGGNLVGGFAVKQLIFVVKHHN